MQNLIPSHHDFSVPFEYLQQALVEIDLQPMRSLKVMLLRERLDSVGRVPLFPVHFIAAYVHVWIGKQSRHLAEEAVEELISRLARRIHDVVEDPPRALNLRWPFHTHQLWIPREPARRV